MNRHRATEDIRQELKKLIAIHGLDKVTAAIRKLYGEEKQC